jgi:uncharacterized membrane protein YjjB (DUF3815 family)
VFLADTSAHLIEAIISSFLIATSIMTGLFTAERIMGVNESDEAEYMDCNDPISELWFFLVAPIVSTGWAAGFLPLYWDMPLMALHGTMAFAVSWAVECASNESCLASFVAALTTSTVAGLLSRFTGRQALGDTFTGLYALVPGICITEGFSALAMGNNDADETILFFNLLLKSVTIAVGAWFGTLLCATTYLGTNAGIQTTKFKDDKRDGLGAMLFA